MAFYTFCLDDEGGTYLAQARGASLQQATSAWCAGLTDADLAGWGLSRVDLDGMLLNGSPVPLSGQTNVWCQTGSTRAGHFILLNIIKTAE